MGEWASGRVKDDKTLPIRAFILVLGASIAIAGMTTERDWLVSVAMGVIAVGLVLALYRRKKRDKSALEE